MFVRFLKTVIGLGTTKMVLIVRTDLTMSHGKIASQCAHAAVSLYDISVKNKDNTILKQWIKWGQPKVVLKVDCENILQKMYEEAKNSGLNACLVHDAGKTQIQRGTLTVLGIGPDLVENIDKITSNLKLL